MSKLLASKGMIFESLKTYTHSVGLSCCFRQWRASSHCSFLHGYALQVTITFRSQSGDPDDKNWIMDFGGLKPIKEWLEDKFDHKTLIARDDPEANKFEILHDNRLIDLRFVDHVGCEAFAKMIHDHVAEWLADLDNGVYVQEVEVREHQGNAARYRRNS